MVMMRSGGEDNIMRSYSLSELKGIKKNIELGTMPTKKTMLNILHQVIKAEVTISDNQKA